MKLLSLYDLTNSPIGDGFRRPSVKERKKKDLDQARRLFIGSVRVSDPIETDLIQV